MENPQIHATTVICVRRDGEVAMAGDGQVTVGNTVMKHGAAKVRRLYHDKILAGFAGSAADAFALFSRFEAKLEEYRGNMERSVVELAKDWRMDKYLRQLQAMLIVANNEKAFLVSGNGDLIQPDDGILAIGSGGSFALAAARALMKHTNMTASEIAKESMHVASQICIYTNDNITVETL
jgi:ATP-dependent HslUV protease, peptidase subunit HslV